MIVFIEVNGSEKQIDYALSMIKTRRIEARVVLMDRPNRFYRLDGIYHPSCFKTLKDMVAHLFSNWQDLRKDVDKL